MAYAYSAIDEMMSGNSGQSNQNIFAQQGQSGQNQGSANGQNSQVKTSSEGDVNNAPPSANSIPSAPTVASSGATNEAKTTQAAYKANAGKTQAPSALKTFQNKINTAQSGLAQQASDYAAQQSAKQNYNLGQDKLDKAVKNQDLNAQSDVMGLLGQKTAKQVDAFTPTNVGVDDVNLLNSNAGIKELVSRGRRPTYTSNMAAFDSMLLQADPNFQRQVQDIKGSANALNQSVQDTTAQAQTAAQNAAQANLTSSQQAVKDYLNGYQNQILAKQQADAAAANAALPQTIAAQKAQVEANLLRQQQQRAQAALDSVFGAGRATSQLGAVKEDPSKYINWLSSYDPSHFVTGQQAQEFNTINGLLGIGGQQQQAAGALPSLYSSNDTALYNSLVDKATQARQAADVSDRAQIQQIMDAAAKQASQDNSRRLGLVKSYDQDVNAAAQRILQGKEFQGFNPTAMPGLIQRTIADYIKNAPAANSNLGAMDLISAEQANKLNALSKDLGLSTVYSAGKGAGPQSLVNENSLKKALNDAMINYNNYVANAPRIPNPNLNPNGTSVKDIEGNAAILVPDEMLNKPAVQVRPGSAGTGLEYWGLG